MSDDLAIKCALIGLGYMCIAFGIFILTESVIMLLIFNYIALVVLKRIDKEHQNGEVKDCGT